MTSRPRFGDRRRASTGDVMLQWPCLLALAVLICNDHWWKWTFGTWWTGKLSGMAALVVVPFVAVALVEAAVGPLPTRRAVRVAALAGCATAGAMAVVETTAFGVAAYEVGLGVLRWPLDAAGALLAGRNLPGLQRVAQFRDVTDLLTLPAAAVPALWLSRQLTGASGSPTGRGRPG